MNEDAVNAYNYFALGGYAIAFFGVLALSLEVVPYILRKNYISAPLKYFGIASVLSGIFVFGLALFFGWEEIGTIALFFSDLANYQFGIMMIWAAIFHRKMKRHYGVEG